MEPRHQKSDGKDSISSLRIICGEWGLGKGDQRGGGRGPSGGDQEVILYVSKKLEWFAFEITALDKKLDSVF